MDLTDIWTAVPCPTGLTDIWTIGNHCLASLPDANLGEVVANWSSWSVPTAGLAGDNKLGASDLSFVLVRRGNEPDRLGWSTNGGLRCALNG